MRRCKVLLITSLLLLNYGCALFHPESLEADRDGHYIKHFHSCGPVALKKALGKLDVHVTEKELSKQIQSSGNLTRVLLTLIHHEMIGLTLPSEIKNICLDYGYKVSKVENLDSLDPEKDIAIVLVGRNILKGETHWVCFPIDNNVENYFGEGTRVLKVYLLKKVI